jgi:hypothetical protein
MQCGDDPPALPAGPVRAGEARQQDPDIGAERTFMEHHLPAGQLLDGARQIQERLLFPLLQREAQGELVHHGLKWRIGLQMHMHRSKMYDAGPIEADSVAWTI